MNYWSLNAIFLAVVAVVTIVAILLRRPRGIALALLVSGVILLVMTAVFDNVMIAIGLVGYDPGKISGAFLGRAPLEDFAYAIAAVLLLPSLWLLLGRRDARS
jgi:lycopene cyclase domain-containing protein